MVSAGGCTLGGARPLGDVGDGADDDALPRRGAALDDGDRLDGARPAATRRAITAPRRETLM